CAPGSTGSTRSALTDLPDPGSDDSILSEFRARVAGGGPGQVVPGTLLERLGADGVGAAGGGKRTDSTHVVAAVRDLGRLELAGEAVRAWRRWRWPRRTGWPVTGTIRGASGTPRGPAPGGCPPPRRGKTRARWPAAATAAPC